MVKKLVSIVLENGGNGHRGLDAFTLSGELTFHDDHTVTGALVLAGGGARECFAATGTYDEASRVEEGYPERLGTR